MWTSMGRITKGPSRKANTSIVNAVVEGPLGVPVVVGILGLSEEVGHNFNVVWTLKFGDFYIVKTP